jgi:hypothetical protein
VYWGETCSLTLNKEHKLKVNEIRMLRRIFGLLRRKKKEDGEDCIMRNLAKYY